MLKLVLYNNIESVIDEEYFKDSTVITPSPTLSDNLRSQLQKNGINDCQVTTISKFISTQIKTHFDPEIIGNLKGKNDIFLLMSVLWKRLTTDRNVHTFKGIYKKFTDLRGHSLDLNLISSILETYDEETSRLLVAFYHFFEQQEIIDEQKGYSLLSDFYKNNPDKSEVTGKIVFWGFTFLSGTQIDLINLLAMNEKIYFPFPKGVYDKSLATDWVKWLKHDELNEVKSKKDFSECEIIFHRKGTLNKVLKKINDHSNIFFVKSNVEYNHLFSTSIENIYMKTTQDFFELEKLTFKSVIREMFWKSSEYEKVNVDNFLDFIKNHVKEILGESLINYKYLKILTTFRTLLIKWQEMLEENDHLVYFDFIILFEILELDLPRISCVCLNDDASSMLKTIDDFCGEDERQNLLCVTNEDLYSSNEYYNDDMAKMLAVLGPIKRRKFELEIIKEKICQILKSKSSKLLIDPTVLKQNQFWYQVVKEIDRNPLVIDSESEDIRNSVVDSVHDENVILDKMSASRFQVYIDCPKKYYFKYVKKTFPNVSSNALLMPNELGIFEHEMIGRICKKTAEISLIEIDSIIKQEYDLFIRNLNKKVSVVEEKKAFLEIKTNIKNGVMFIEALRECFGHYKDDFEVNIKKTVGRINYLGSIDYSTIGENNNQIIIDFKRSSGGIPRIIDINELKKIQMSYYMTHGRHNVSELSICGYLNLSDVEKSLIFVKDKEIQMKVNGIFQKVYSLIKGPARIMNFYDHSNNYKLLEEIKLKELNNCKDYFPIPREDKVCNYCYLDTVCTKGIQND